VASGRCFATQLRRFGKFVTPYDLLTRFLSSDGVAEISDFMTLGDLDGGSRLVRRVKAVRGSIQFRMRCMPRFDYARLEHKISAEAGTVIFTGSDNLALRLRASVPVDVSEGAALLWNMRRHHPAGYTGANSLPQVGVEVATKFQWNQMAHTAFRQRAQRNGYQTTERRDRRSMENFK